MALVCRVFCRYIIQCLSHFYIMKIECFVRDYFLSISFLHSIAIEFIRLRFRNKMLLLLLLTFSRCFPLSMLRASGDDRDMCMCMYLKNLLCFVWIFYSLSSSIRFSSLVHLCRIDTPVRQTERTITCVTSFFFSHRSLHFFSHNFAVLFLSFFNLSNLPMGSKISTIPYILFYFVSIRLTQFILFPIESLLYFSFVPYFKCSLVLNLCSNVQCSMPTIDWIPYSSYICGYV